MGSREGGQVWLGAGRHWWSNQARAGAAAALLLPKFLSRARAASCKSGGLGIDVVQSVRRSVDGRPGGESQNLAIAFCNLVGCDSSEKISGKGI